MIEWSAATSRKIKIPPRDVVMGTKGGVRSTFREGLGRMDILGWKMGPGEEGQFELELELCEAAENELAWYDEEDLTPAVVRDKGEEIRDRFLRAAQVMEFLMNRGWMLDSCRGLWGGEFSSLLYLYKTCTATNMADDVHSLRNLYDCAVAPFLDTETDRYPVSLQDKTVLVLKEVSEY